MFFQIIETSSAGNSAFLSFHGRNILIDAGVGIRKIDAYLKGRGASRADIDAIFVTHEHIDHCRALKSFRGCRAKIFANRCTAEAIRSSEPSTKALDWAVFESGDAFKFGEFCVSSFPTPHDSSDSVGYCFDCSNKRLVWMTDLGKVTFVARDFAKSANVLVLESNYCPRMLDNSSRPYSLKTRIKSSHGHLSNADAIELLKSIDCGVSEKIYLAHISRECNSVSHIRDLLSGVGEILQKIEIVSPFSQSSTPYTCEDD